MGSTSTDGRATNTFCGRGDSREEVSLFVFHANLIHSVYGIPTIYRQMTFLRMAQEQHGAYRGLWAA